MPTDVVDTTQQTVETEGSDTQTTETDTETVSGSEQTTEDGDKTDAEKAAAEKAAAEKVVADKEKADVTTKQQEFLSNLLLEHDLESPEQLGEFIKDLSKLKGKVGDLDIDDLVENKALMTKYQKHWAAQEASKKKEGETEAETIKRLEGELDTKSKAEQNAKSQSDELKENKQALDSFNATVTKAIKGITNIPEEYRSYLSLFMGVENPINEVDLKDRGKIIELTKSGGKQMLDFEQVVIKRYIEKKTDVPAVTTTTDTSTETGEKPIKSISDARKRMAEIVKAKLLKKA